MTPDENTPRQVITLEHLRSVPEQDRHMYADFVSRLYKRMHGLQEDVLPADPEGRPRLEDFFTEEELDAAPWPIEALAVSRYDLEPTGACPYCNEYSPNGKFADPKSFPEYGHLLDEMLEPLSRATTKVCPSCREDIYEDGRVSREKVTTLDAIPKQIMLLLMEMEDEERDTFMALPQADREDWLMGKMYGSLQQ